MAERVLVTGAGGFLGSHVARRLVRDGLDVVALVRPGSGLPRLADLRGEIEVVTVELGAGPAEAVGPLDRVLHLAAAGVVRRATDADVVRANVLGTVHALELARESGARAFLYCGSCFEYGPGERHAEADPLRPISAYGASKAAGWTFAQAFAREHGLHVTGVRPFTVYGPDEAPARLVPTVCLAAARGGAVDLTAGGQTRDFVYVDDAVDAILRASTFAGPGRTFNVCTGISSPVREVAVEIATLAGGNVELRFGALPARAVEFPTLSGDPSAAREALGWEAATSLRDGLKATLDWFAEHAGDGIAAGRGRA